jgi:hypothetical protein
MRPEAYQILARTVACVLKGPGFHSMFRLRPSYRPLLLCQIGGLLIDTSYSDYTLLVQKEGSIDQEKLA